MPIYEYECEKCGERTELLQRMNEAPLAECPECAGKVRRLVSAPAVQFKGTGWYVTDYGGRKSEPTSSEKSAAKTEANSSEDKKSGDKKSGDKKSGDSKSGDSKPSSASDKPSKSATK